MFSKLHRIFTIHHSLFIVALLLVSGLLTACNLSTPTPEPTTVSVRLKWMHQAGVGKKLSKTLNWPPRQRLDSTLVSTRAFNWPR